MEFLNNLNFKKKIFYILFLPFIGLLFYTFLQLKKDINDFTTLNVAKSWIELTVKISDFVHQTQRERGMTAGYLGSSGAKFRYELKVQRDITDKKRENLLGFIKNFDLSSFPKSFQNDLKDALLKIKKIAFIRKKVDNLQITTKEAIKFYSDLNAKLLKDIALISKYTTNSQLKNDISAYSAFLLAKEQTGIERAVGANTFARGSFAKGMKKRLIELINEQKIYLSTFTTYANKKVLDFYKKILEDKSIKQVQEMEKMLLNDRFSVEPTTWFKIISKKINLFKKLDDFQSNFIKNQVENIKNNSIYNLIFFTLVSLTMFGVMIFLINKMTTLIDQRMKIILNGLHYFVSYIAREESDLKMINLKGNDEFSQMANLINKETNRVKEVIEADKKVVNEIDKIVKRVSDGFFDSSIQNKASTYEVERLKENINFMIKETKIKFDILIKILKHYSNKDFDFEISDEDRLHIKGDFKEVLEYIKLFGSNMKELLSLLSQTANDLNQSMQVLINSSQKLNHSSQNQKLEVIKTDKAIENLRDLTNKTLKYVKNIDVISQELTKNSDEGVKNVEITEKSTEEIFKRIEAISEAIEIVDQIAFQTNILSLNAAVEAATAGDAGKGFAVVASEVRNLANKSAEAASKIKELVNEAEEKANQGKEIVNSLKRGFDRLNQKISQTNQVIETISSMNKEQSKKFSEVDEHISKIDKISKEEIVISKNIDNLVDEIDGLSKKLVSYI